MSACWGVGVELEQVEQGLLVEVGVGEDALGAGSALVPGRVEQDGLFDAAQGRQEVADGEVHSTPEWTSPSATSWRPWAASKRPSCSTRPGTRADPAPNASSPTPTSTRRPCSTCSSSTPTPQHADMGNTDRRAKNEPGPARIPPKAALARKVPLGVSRGYGSC